MKYKLPVFLEDNELPNRKVKRNNRGYVSFMYLLSNLITLGTIIAILFVRK